MVTIVTRAGKGSPLTNNEVDANFTNLNTGKVEKNGYNPNWLGAQASDPTVNLDGGALTTGALYYRTTTTVGYKVYNGTAWVDLVGTVAAGSIGTTELADGGVTAAKLSGAQSGSAPIYGARAWVNFNGTGTVAIRGSGNVTSITDNGTGDYTVNFTTAMQDVNYAVLATTYDATGASPFIKAQNTSASTSRVQTYNSGGSIDRILVSVSVFR